VKEAAEKRNAQKIKEILCKIRVFEGSRISIEFDIFRYVSIFLMIFGHNLGTNDT